MDPSQLSKFFPASQALDSDTEVAIAELHLDAHTFAQPFNASCLSPRKSSTSTWGCYRSYAKPNLLSGSTAPLVPHP